jgi:hypothetical protein
MILEPVAGGGGGSLYSTLRWNITLTGTYDGVNRVFTIPDPVVYTPPFPIVKLYHGGRCMKLSEFEVYENVPASGDYNRVRLLEFAPRATDLLFADYIAA